MYKFLLTGFMALFAQAALADLIILQYHHVADDTPAVTSISPAQFRKHLQLLEDEGMQVVSLPDAIAALKNGQQLPPRSVAITFDDAYGSIYQNAFPMLAKRNWPFTIFVNPGPVDRGLPDIISWDQLREMQASGATIANHTMEHPYLIERPQGMSLEQWMKQEVVQADERIQAEMGTSYRFLAYPYGEYSLEIADWLAQHDYTAFGQQSGPAGIDSWWQSIPRFPAAGQYANIDTLKGKLKTLAFNTGNAASEEPALGRQNPPSYTLSFQSDDVKLDALQCYASGEGRIEHTLDHQSGEATLGTWATKAITAGRGRYNCTAPSKSQPGYFYWHSQLWINTSVENR